MTEIVDRLDTFLREHDQAADAEPLTADASTREYFRIQWHGHNAIACVYPEPYEPAVGTYADVTSLFSAAHLPVAEVYHVDHEAGMIIQEDLGDEILRDVLTASAEPQRMRLLREAISLIARIQTATPIAFERKSIASVLRFDTEKLLWELGFFKTHYFETYRQRPLEEIQNFALVAEFNELAAELDGYASVLCHRDFHAANLMLDPNKKMRIIDHQDARIGSVAYDLVSLLLDRIAEPPSPEFLAEKRRYFLNIRRTLGLPMLDEAEFAYEFRLQTVQRCLKAVGTFSYQAVHRGKSHFIPFIAPMFRIVLRAANNIDRFPVLRGIIERELDER